MVNIVYAVAGSTERVDNVPRVPLVNGWYPGVVARGVVVGVCRRLGSDDDFGAEGAEDLRGIADVRDKGLHDFGLVAVKDCKYLRYQSIPGEKTHS